MTMLGPVRSAIGCPWSIGACLSNMLLPFAGMPLGPEIVAAGPSGEPQHTAAAADPASHAAAPQESAEQLPQHLAAAEADGFPQSDISCSEAVSDVSQPKMAIVTAQRRIAQCSGDREWGRADSASTFGGHATVGLRKAREQCRNATDLMRLPGAHLRAGSTV